MAEVASFSTEVIPDLVSHEEGTKHFFRRESCPRHTARDVTVANGEKLNAGPPAGTGGR